MQCVLLRSCLRLLWPGQSHLRQHDAALLALLQAAGHALTALRVKTTEDGVVATVLAMVGHPIAAVRRMGYKLLNAGT